MKNYHIRSISLEELKTPFIWAEQEGWRPGINDAGHFYPTDSQGFFMGFLDDEPIGSISAVAYDNSFGFIGLYIVRPDFRHQGYGMALWNTAMQHLQDRNIGLDGVIAQQKNYSKSGFKLAYRNLRFQTKGAGHKLEHSDLVSLSAIPFAKVLAYDCFPAPRPAFLKSWIKQRQGNALGMVVNQQLVGFGVIRACHQSHRIGPLFADEPAYAETLLNALLAFAPAETFVFIDVPEVNRDALSLVEQYRMPLVFEAARMYSKVNPSLDLNKIYGISTLELG
ncbi:MAG: GNAT family N-acetyltransferase [Methylococcales bacterium]|nr:GNAT family N-acetyltransferase [Methylococcales bacterium]